MIRQPFTQSRPAAQFKPRGRPAPWPAGGLAVRAVYRHAGSSHPRSNPRGGRGSGWPKPAADERAHSCVGGKAAAPVTAFLGRRWRNSRARREKPSRLLHLPPWAVNIELRHLGPGLEDLISPGLPAPAAADGERADLIVYCCDVESTDSIPAGCPGGGDDIGPQGDIGHLAATDLRASWDPEAGPCRSSTGRARRPIPYRIAPGT